MMEIPPKILGGLNPWDPDKEGFIEAARRQVSFDMFALAVFHGKNPQLDELLAQRGVLGETATRLCSTSLESSDAFRTARKHGHATITDSHLVEELGLGSGSEAMLHVLPESLSEPRWWCLLMANNNRPFTLAEQRIAGLMLRQWQVGFDQVAKPPVFRMLIGHDDRLIHSDPWTQVQLLEHPDMLTTLTATLHAVVQQRWPAIVDGTVYDFALKLVDKPFWVRFHRNGNTQVAESEHWYIELHPLDEGELPLVGGIADPRVARAVGYIHQNYREAPGLAEIAAHVNASPFHFHRLFTGALGISPKHYLQQKQLQVARWLLRTTRQPIGNIAAQAGFTSHGHFSSTFQRLVGKSPSQYRDETA